MHAKWGSGISQSAKTLSCRGSEKFACHAEHSEHIGQFPAKFKKIGRVKGTLSPEPGVFCTFVAAKQIRSHATRFESGAEDLGQASLSRSFL